MLCHLQRFLAAQALVADSLAALLRQPATGAALEFLCLALGLPQPAAASLFLQVAQVGDDRFDLQREDTFEIFHDAIPSACATAML